MSLYSGSWISRPEYDPTSIQTRDSGGAWNVYTKCTQVMVSGINSQTGILPAAPRRGPDSEVIHVFRMFPVFRTTGFGRWRILVQEQNAKCEGHVIGLCDIACSEAGILSRQCHYKERGGDWGSGLHKTSPCRCDKPRPAVQALSHHVVTPRKKKASPWDHRVDPPQHMK